MGTWLDLHQADLGGLQGWLDGPLAMDILRAERLRSAGYRVTTQLIPGDITPKNRLLLAEPVESAPDRPLTESPLAAPVER